MEHDASWLSVAGNNFIHQVRYRAITRKSESLCGLSKSGGGGGMGYGVRRSYKLLVHFGNCYTELHLKI